MTSKRWTRQNSKVLFKHPRLTVVEDDVTLPSGETTKYMRHEGEPDYVTVIVEDDNKIALTHEYSYPHDTWLWQFPEGSIDKGEDPLLAAQRELSEEAGLEAELTLIGQNHDHHRRNTRQNYIFLGINPVAIDKARGDLEEGEIELQWFEISKLQDMITNGEIVQKNALAALAVYFAYKNAKVS